MFVLTFSLLQLEAIVPPPPPAPKRALIGCYHGVSWVFPLPPCAGLEAQSQKVAILSLFLTCYPHWISRDEVWLFIYSLKKFFLLVYILTQKHIIYGYILVAVACPWAEQPSLMKREVLTGIGCPHVYQIWQQDYGSG